jgi:glycyl-tRNA synthetase
LREVEAPPPLESLPVEGREPFLLEIGTEELPTEDLEMALAQLRDFVPVMLDDARLGHGEIHVWGTPRRLAVFVEALAMSQTDEEREVKGPPAKVAFKDGEPTRAATGFARSQGIDVEEMRVEEVDGGEYVVATVRSEGRPTAEVLGELLPVWVDKLHFPRSMRWNETGIAFSRPIRWFVALLDEVVVPFDYAGLESGRVTRGPRPAGSPDIALSDAAAYRPTLRSYGVLVDPEERREAIRAQAESLAREVDGSIPNDPALLQEVANLVEVPTALRGSFESKYLELPQEALIAVMKKHQRYFPVLDVEGEMLPYFITVRNGGGEHLDVVRSGNENVIRARYADAAYFYDKDTRRTLEEFLPRLGTLTFQQELGSMRDKSERLESLAPWIGLRLGLPPVEIELLGRAAHLSKADLATSMVVEMTSLQGTMGREYALHSGEPELVAQAIVEHYLPASAGGRLPETRMGLALALADRLDSLMGLFAVGLVPTGSTDPYGLRRAALGLVELLIEDGTSFSVRQGLREAARLMPVKVTDEALDMAMDFVKGRLDGVLREKGFAYDVVDATLAERGDDPFLALKTAHQLTEWVNKGSWDEILDNYARCVRITRGHPAYELDPELLQAPAEGKLYAALDAVEDEVSVDSSVEELFNQFLPLVPLIQGFFDEVLVMAEDETLRRARLALLQRIAGLTIGIVDLSRLERF